MKRTIIIEVLLLFILGVLISLFVTHIDQTITWFGDINWNIEQGFEPIDIVYKRAYTNLTYSIFSSLASVFDIAIMIIIAIQNFKAFQPIIEKYHSRKSNRLAARQAKAEEEKQKQIAELEKKLDELKKD